MSDQEYAEALNQTKGIVIKRIEELEAQLTALREAVQDYLDYDSDSTYEVLAALLEVNDDVQ